MSETPFHDLVAAAREMHECFLAVTLRAVAAAERESSSSRAGRDARRRADRYRRTLDAIDAALAAIPDEFEERIESDPRTVDGSFRRDCCIITIVPPAGWEPR